MEENKVVKAGIGYTIGNYLITGLNFLTIPIFARLLTTSDYGIYNTFSAYQSILFIFISLAINISYKNARYKYKLEKENSKNDLNFETYVSTTLLMIIINASILLIFSNLFHSLIESILGIDIMVMNFLILASFGQAIISCYNARESLTYNYKNFLKTSLINAISNISISLIFIIFVLESNKYLGRIYGNTVPLFILSIIIIINAFKTKKPKNIKDYLKWGLSYSIPIVPHAVSQILLSQFDRIMINKMVNASAAGIYSFAYTIFTIISVTYTSLDTVWSQWFYEKMRKKDYSLIKTKSNVYVIGMFLFSCLMIMLCPEIIMILGGEKYYDSIYCAIPIIAGGYFSFLYLIPAAVEYYNEKTKYIAIGTTASAVINIILNYIFILKYNYVAAAYTTLVTYLLNFIFHYFLAWKIEKKCLFSTKIIFSTLLLILFISFGTIYLIENRIIRFIIAIILGIILTYIEEKNIGFIKKLKLKLIKGRNNNEL